MIACLPFLRSFRRAAALAGAAVLFAATAPTAQAEEAYQPVFGPAIDWSILARLTESIQVESNRRLDGDSDVEALGTVGLNLNVNGVGKRTRFSLSTGFRAGRSTEGDASNLNRLDPNLSATAVFLGKNYSINAQVSGSTQPTSVSELVDSGVTGADATRFDVRGSVGVNWQATKRDSLSVSATAQVVDFSRLAGSFTPSQTFGVSGSWSRQATQTTSFSLSTSFRHFDSDGANGRTSRTANVEMGVQHRRTSRHVLGGSAGFSVVSSDRANGRDTTQIGFVGGGSFGYTADDFNADLSVNQSIQPSSDGDLNAFTSLSGSLGYRINALQSLGFGVTYTRRSDISGGGDVLQFLSLGPNYSYSLTKDSSLSLGYQFRVRDDAANDFQTGHQVSLTLSHNLAFLD